MRSISARTSALSSLKGTVTGHFGSVRSSLESHLSSLTATDWTGNAKDQVVGEVSKRTAGAKSKADEAERALNQFIQQQVEDVQKADKA